MSFLKDDLKIKIPKPKRNIELAMRGKLTDEESKKKGVEINYEL